MRRSSLVPVIGGLLLILGVGGFFLLFERVEEEVEVGYQGAARTNPFLAAERLFTHLGAPARTLAAGPRILPPPDHALLLVSPVRSLSEERFAQILDWVRQGGKLIVTPDEAPSLDPVLRHWSVAVADEPETDAPEAFQVNLREGTKARVEMPRTRRLLVKRTDAQVQEGSEVGLAVVRYAEGQGSVTFLADAGFLTNEGIGLLDHAALAWALVRAGGDVPAGVWIAVRDEVPTLGQLLARHAWMALASLALLIAAWLWSAGARFGPLLPDPPRDRRSLLEHVEASGDFLWRTGRGDELLQGARQALLHRIDVREPGWSRLPAPELVQRLATGARLPAARVDRALHGSAATPADLVHALQTLETLRRTL
jgi:uncharacterized protein DUF4350